MGQYSDLGAADQSELLVANAWWQSGEPARKGARGRAWSA